MNARRIAWAALIMGGLAASRTAAQEVAVGTRVRITTREGLRYQGHLTALDSTRFTLVRDDSSSTAVVARPDVKKLERSLGVEMENYVLLWGEVVNWAAVGAGAWYGARQHGAGGAIIDGLGAGLGSALLLWPFVVRERPAEGWEKVNLSAEVRPVITSGAGGRLLLGVSFSLR